MRPRGVKGEDLLHPTGACHALGLVGLKLRAGRDDERVVGERAAVVEMDSVLVELDVVDTRLVECDPTVQLAGSRPDDLLDCGRVAQRTAECRDAQQAGLVDVPVVFVDHRNLEVGFGIALAKAVGHQRAAGAATEDHDLLLHFGHSRRVSPVES